MRKFRLVAAAIVVGVGFGWIASTKARVAPPMMMSSHTIEPMKMMAGSANLPKSTSSIIRSFTRKYRFEVRARPALMLQALAPCLHLLVHIPEMSMAYIRSRFQASFWRALQRMG